MGYSKSNSKRKIYTNTTVHQETRKTLNKSSKFKPKPANKKKTYPKVNRRKENINFKVEKKKRK